MIEINNRKAKFDYEIVDTIEAGIALKGTEIKSVRKGHVNLKDAFIRFNTVMTVFLLPLVLPQTAQDLY